MPPREWAMAKAQFALLFGERFAGAMARCLTAPPHTKFLKSPGAPHAKLAPCRTAASFNPFAIHVTR